MVPTLCRKTSAFPKKFKRLFFKLPCSLLIQEAHILHSCKLVCQLNSDWLLILPMNVDFLRAA